MKRFRVQKKKKLIINTSSSPRHLLLFLISQDLSGRFKCNHFSLCVSDVTVGVKSPPLFSLRLGIKTIKKYIAMFPKALSSSSSVQSSCGLSLPLVRIVNCLANGSGGSCTYWSKKQNNSSGSISVSSPSTLPQIKEKIQVEKGKNPYGKLKHFSE